MTTKIRIYKGVNSLYPKLYNNSGQLLAVLDNIIKESASVKRVVNGEFTFNFSAYEKELKSEYFAPENVIVIDGQTFDIKYIEQEHEVDVQYAIQCEHVNYRMEDGSQNLFPSYTYTGTPAQILANILSGTDFSVGTVEFTNAITITVNAEITRKSLIYELANAVGGEVDYTNLGYTINILASIGRNNGFEARFGKNLKGIRKIIDNRGGLKTYYSVDIIMLKNSNEYIEKELRDLEIIDVGDTIQLIDPVIGLDVQNRILSREYNPIFEVNTKVEIANNIELITTKIKQIETSTVHKGKIYNGVHISAEDGFVAERSDGKVKTINNATEGISVYSDKDDDNGLVRRFYVDDNGRIQGKSLDIDGDSKFHGEVNVKNGLVNVKIAPTGGYPFEILYDGNKIFFVDSQGSGTYKGNVSIGNNSKVKITDFGGAGRIAFEDDQGDMVAYLIANQLTSNSFEIVGCFDTRMEISTVNGDLNIESSSGDVYIHNTAGDVYLGIKDDPSHINVTTYLSRYTYIDSSKVANQYWVDQNFSPLGHSHSYATQSDINNAIAAHVSAYHSGI